MKIVCLGNEFVKEDSLAVRVGGRLRLEGFDVLHVKDSFELMSVLSEVGGGGLGVGDDIVVLDVALGIDKVCEIGVSDLKHDSINSAHDFDASYVLGLLEEDVRIIGIPLEGDLEEIVNAVKKIL